MGLKVGDGKAKGSKARSGRGPLLSVAAPARLMVHIWACLAAPYDKQQHVTPHAAPTLAAQHVLAPPAACNNQYRIAHPPL